MHGLYIEKKRSKWRPLINAGIATAVLLVLFVGGGVAYTWYVGQHTPKDAASIAKPEADPAPAPKTPTMPAANVPVSVSVQSITSPVAPGSNASFSIHTLPTASCTVAVEYNHVAAKDSGLVAHTASEHGVVTWSWTVDPAAPTGKWPVKAVCSRGDKSAMVESELVLMAPADIQKAEAADQSQQSAAPAEPTPISGN